MRFIKIPSLKIKFIIFVAFACSLAACNDISDDSAKPPLVAISGRAQGSCHLFEGTEEAVCVETYYGGLVRSDHRQMTSADQMILSSAAQEMCTIQSRDHLRARSFVDPSFHFSALEGCNPIPTVSAYCVKDSTRTLVSGELIWIRVTMQVSTLVEQSMHAHCLDDNEPDVIVRWLTPLEFQSLPPMELHVAPSQVR